MNAHENRRILLVDDMPDIHQDFRKILVNDSPNTPVHFELDSAFQGQEALDKVCAALQENRPYAMAFVDMRMQPGWDGVETIEHLWEKDPLLQIVICTAYSDYSWEEVLSRLEIRDRLLILKKPFDAIEVYQLANSLTTKWQLIQQTTTQIGQLEKTAQQHIDELGKVQAKLADSVRQAGMADIATNVLHNVGNVLNSLKISIGIINKTMRASKSEGLAKVVQMLNEHAQDLGNFLTNDKKGQLLPQYIQKLAEMLGVEQKNVLEEIGQMIKSVDHIQEIIMMQQSYARVAGSVTSVVEMVQIRELIEDALRMNAESFMRHQVTVVKELADVPPLALDKHRTLLIMINLISNAKQAMSGVTGRPHQLTLRVELIDEKRLRIQVADQGKGIAPENLTQIFSRGFTTRKEGHGFGLHSCALAAKEMGGTLTAYSEGPDQGATFTLEIPI